MNKKVYIKENDLFNIKRFMTGEQTSHKPFIADNKPPYEKDEFEIGGEGNNPPVGGNFYHVNESTSFDSSEVGAVNYSWDFDEEEYQEWLQEAEYENTQEALMEYINDNVEFELEYLDNETYHTCGCDYVDYNALEDMFGEKKQKEILTTCMSDGSGSFETVNLYSDDDVDINDRNSVNDMAMRLLRHGDYFKDCRGFILTNGVVVYTESEHNEICRIPNINNKFDFIRMGNIRVLPQSINIGDKPTSEQRDVLRRAIASYADEELYLDIYQGKSSIGAHYIHPDWRYVMGEIDRFYSEGIKPQGNEYYESKNKNLLDGLNINESASFDSSEIGAVMDINAIAKKIQTKGNSSYILTNGEVITFRDHSEISKINGMTVGKFLNLGNIRIGNLGGIELIKKPTKEQIKPLKKHIIEFNGSLFLDIASYKEGRFYAEMICGAEYKNANPNRIINDILTYFDEGIKPQGNRFYESKKNKYNDRGNLSLSESKNKIGGKSILTESQESKSIAAAKKLVMQKLNYNEQEADEFIRIKLRNDIPTLRTPQGSKFILGVARMSCDGELRTANDNGNLNSTLKLVASDAHINEYDRNLNGLSAQELIQRFAKAMNDNLEAEKAEINQMVFDTPSDYEIVRIDSFEQSSEYGDYVSWCVTHDEDMFDSYTSDGINQFYFCLKNGFENVEEAPSEGCPLDEYGLSMIAVSVNENGMLNTCTCRWNHDNGGNDSIMSAKELSQIIGMNFFEAFKPNNKWKELIANVMQRLANGESPIDIFYYVGNFNEGFAIVKLGDKCNFINQEFKILSDQWYDDCEDFHNGFAKVEIGNKWTFIREDGKRINNELYDNCGNFYGGFGRVEIGNKWTFIRQDGQHINDELYDNCGNFYGGFGRVKIGSKWTFIRQDGQHINDELYDNCEDFHNGFGRVKIGDKWTFIREDGKRINNELYDYCGNFYGGFGRVKIGSKWTFIREDGKRVNNELYDYCYDFGNGFAEVQIGDKWYKIDTSGRRFNIESVEKNNKKLIINENQLIALKENIETEVESSEINLSSFKKNDSLAKRIWDGMDLNPRVRLRLLDIADDFWEYANISWVKPKGIHLTGSICNYNWSKFSDIDLHIVVDFSEIDERTDFIQEYFNSKKNEWNEEHSKLKIYGYPVELYVEDVNAETVSNGLYDLEQNKWITEPDKDSVKQIGLDKYEIKSKSAKLMTKIDDLCDKFGITDDDFELREIGKTANKLFNRIKRMRKLGLSRGGETDPFNIVYKVLRRSGYLENLWKLKSELYDKLNSIEVEENVISNYYNKFIGLNEEVVADGNADFNPFKQRWKHEREVLKDYLVNYGEIMTSKENGKEYKVLYDRDISNRVGINYCLCIQWNSITMEPGNIIYVRAFDKFTRRRFKPQFDYRGRDNVAGTSDDVV